MSRSSKNTPSVGRPRKILGLASPQIIHDICIELVYRIENYERKIDECLSYIKEKGWADIYCNIADDENKVKEFLDNKYLKVLKERLLLGAGIADTLEEVSHPSVVYWLSRLQKKAKNTPHRIPRNIRACLIGPFLIVLFRGPFHLNF